MDEDGVKIDLTLEQAQLLHEELECLVECKYDWAITLDEDDWKVLWNLVQINKQLCEALDIDESTTGCYQRCLADLEL